MATPILATKLYAPPPRSMAVARRRLTERLSQGLAAGRRLTVIAAPAGFGKTTLASEWIASVGRPAAWLSLDEGDNDPTRFLTYLVAAVRTVAAKLAEDVMAMLQSPQPPPTEVVLTALLNEIAALPTPLVLVLDDYHVIESQAVDQTLTYLLEHLPPQLHVVVSTREDPPLPLARYRARGQLTELRAADLRFSGPEAAEFLSQVMGLSVSAPDLAALEDRTEGWVAGLQLAALSMQGRPDVSEFIQALAGDHRYIADYLVEEVLERQPERVRRFLLQTSILDRLNGPLCDALTGQHDGTAQLHALERGNFLVVALDDRRHWYRYHHLFAGVLQAHLSEEQPAQVPALHRRASEWYERQGSTAEAIRHALAAQDFERAASLVEPTVPDLLKSRQEAVLLGWLQALPNPVVRRRPVLSAGYASVLMSNGEFDGVEDRLREAERWLERTTARSDDPDDPSAPMVVVDEAAFRRLPGAIAVARAGLALAMGNVPETVKFARQALDLIPEDDYVRHGSAAALLGLAAWTSGDLEAAYRSYAEGMASLHKAGHLSDVLGCSIALADIRIAQGRLHEARQTYEHALQLANRPGAPALRGTGDMYVGLAELARERNDLPVATQFLLSSQALGERKGLPQYPYRRRVALARIKAAQGNLDGAVDSLEEAERLYTGDFSPNVRPIPALKARLCVAQGRLSEAQHWALEQGLSVDDDLSYLREFEHLTLARVLLAQAQANNDSQVITAVQRLLARLQHAAEAGGRTGSVIEAHMLLALARQAQGDLATAVATLTLALQLGEPEGFVRLFLDEGAPMARLLREAAAHGPQPRLAHQLLAAIEPEPPAALAGVPRPTAPAPQLLLEPLSQRELEVLRLFKADLSGPEIAEELVIALSTLRTHTKRIYSKLNVNSRRAAVTRATELGLI